MVTVSVFAMASVFAGVVFRTWVQKNRPPMLDCIITKLLRLSPGKTDCFISKGQRVVWPEMREEFNHTSRDLAGDLGCVPGKAD